MDLNLIMSRVRDGLMFVDTATQTINQNQRTGEDYLPGVKTLTEPQFVSEVASWWSARYPQDFANGMKISTEVPYPGSPRSKCDIVIGSGQPSVNNEWAIEVKHIALVGNNGKTNDYGIAKILSPYLKDRSLIHDINRLQNSGLGKRKAVIGYCFDYSFASCEEAARLHPQHKSIVDNILDVCSRNDPERGELSPRPLVSFADRIFSSLNLTTPLQELRFDGAWRHPCGGSGYVFGWELV